MIKVNWKVRKNNPVFIAQIVASVFLPILAYFGYKWEDMTSWGALLGVLLAAVKNPVVVISSILAILNSIPDPTTSGLGDSVTAQEYNKPR